MLRALGLRRGPEVRRGPVERRVAPPRVGIRVVLGLAAAALGGCGEKDQSPALPNMPTAAADAGLLDIPQKAVDAGRPDVGAEAEIMDITGAPPDRVFSLGMHAPALRLNQLVSLSFELPADLRQLFGKVKYWGIIGPRVDREGLSPFELIDFQVDPATGKVTAGIKALQDAFSREPDAVNLWHFVIELGEGEEVTYCYYGLPITSETDEARPDAGHRREDAGHRREDAGIRPEDVPPSPRDTARGETRPRI